MAYTYDENQTPIDGAEALARWIAVMIAQGATIQSHGLGSGALLPGGLLLFTDPTTGADALRATDAFVEVVLVGTKTLLIQRRADNASWLIQCCPVLLDDTAGTGSVPGTNPDLRTFHDGALFLAEDPAGAFRCSVAAGTRTIGSGVGAYLEAWDIGTGVSRTVLMVDPVEGPTGDLDPYVHYAQFSANAGNVVFISSFRVGIGQLGHAWWKYGTPDQAWVLAAVPYRNVQGGDSGEHRAFPGAGAISGFASPDDLFPLFWIVETASNVYRFKGNSTMVFQDFVARATGWTLGAPTTDYVNVESGALCFPWPVGVPSVI